MGKEKSNGSYLRVHSTDSSGKSANLRSTVIVVGKPSSFRVFVLFLRQCVVLSEIYRA